jgi:hypothetical protein
MPLALKPNLWTGSTSTMKKYYYTGTTRVAMRTGSGTGTAGINWLFGDHLGSQSVTTDANGAWAGQVLYKAWGEDRYVWGTTPTSYRYTGQRKDSYNIQFAFCDELKAYLTGYVRSGDTYTANGATGMIQEIIAHLKEEDLEITFRMDSGYFDDAILETIESLDCRYVIKGKGYPTLVAQVTDPSITFVTGESGRETTEFVTTLNTWEKARRFVVSRVCKDEKDRKQLSFLESEAYDYFFFVTNNTSLSSEEVVELYEKRGNCENYIKEAKYDMAVGHLLLQSFWANEAIFQLMMLAYNLFLLFKMDFVRETEYRQQIKTFRLKYIFLAGKIIRTARSVVMKLSEKYPYQEIYEQSLS